MAFKVLCIKQHEVDDESDSVVLVDIGNEGTARRLGPATDKWQVQWSRGTRQPVLIGAPRDYSTEELLTCSIVDCDAGSAMLRLLESLSYEADEEFWKGVDELDPGERVKFHVPATDLQELARILFSEGL